MTTKYIEIDSSYRDRNQYPSPSQFVVDVSISRNTNTGNYARDPIYKSLVVYPPYNTRKYSLFGSVTPTQFVGIPISEGTRLSTIPNTYSGNILQWVSSTTGGTTTPVSEYRTIVSYSTPYTISIVSTVSDILGYESIWNVSSQKGNNTITYTWTDGTLSTITLSDGTYTIDDVMTKIRDIMKSNTHYLIDNTNTEVYYLNMVVDTTTRTITLQSYPVPSVLPVGWSLPPSSTWTLPGTPSTPQWGILSTFDTWIGIPIGTYPNTTQTTYYSMSSTVPGTYFQPIQVYIDSIPISTVYDYYNVFAGWNVTFTNTNDPSLKDVSRTVVYYRSVDRRIFFDRPISVPIVPGDSFVLTLDTFLIETDQPFSITPNPIDLEMYSTDYNAFVIRTDIPGTENTFVSVSGSTFQTVQPIHRPITGYMVHLSQPIVLFTGNLVSVGTNTFSVGFSYDVESCFVRVLSGVFQGSTFKIIGWNGTIANIEYPWNTTLQPSVGDTVEIVSEQNVYRMVRDWNPDTQTGTVVTPFTLPTRQQPIPLVFSGGELFEILDFERDNYHEIDFPESSISHQQIHCYEIRLVSLTIPNTLLRNGKRIWDYPFIYIEFSSVTQGTSAYDFSSNNPNVTKNIMFRVPIIYTFHSREVPFIIADGHGMVQTLKFKTKDAFKVSVYLSDGTLLPLGEDTVSPYPPNPHLQISLCFGIRRL